MTARQYDQLLLMLLKAYALCAPVLYVRFGGNALAFVDVVSPAAVLMLALRQLRGLRPQYILYLLFILCTLLSVMTSKLHTVGAGNYVLAWRLFAISVPFWLVFAFFRFSDDIVRTLVRWLLAGFGFAVALGLVLHFLGIQIQDSQQLWGRGLGGAQYRAGGIVGNSGEYGQTIALFGALLIAAPVLGLRIPAWAMAGGWGMVALALVASSSRGGLVMVLAVALTVAAFRIRQASRLVVYLAGAAAILMAVLPFMDETQLAFMQISATRLDVLNLSGRSGFSESVRLQIWDQLLARAGDIPLLGHGYKGFERTLGTVIDNSFLLTWFEVGVFGFLLFAAFWATTLWRLFADAVQGLSPCSAVGLGLCLAFLVRMQTGGAHASWSTAPLLFMLLGLCLRSGEEARAAWRSRRAAARPGPAPSDPALSPR